MLTYRRRIPPPKLHTCGRCLHISVSRGIELISALQSSKTTAVVHAHPEGWTVQWYDGAGTLFSSSLQYGTFEALMKHIDEYL